MATKKQQTFEDEACTLSRKYTCSAYTTCHVAKKNAYDQAHVSANASQPGLWAEWKAVTRIECLINALGKSAGQLQTEIDACIAMTHSTLSVTFTFYGPTTDPNPCNPGNFQNMTPGNAAFASRWYADITVPTDLAGKTYNGRGVGLPMACASNVCDCWNVGMPACQPSSSNGAPGDSSGAGSESAMEMPAR